MVVDERLDGLAATVFLKRLMEVNAMIDTAVASPLPTEQFHENYEGLGVLMQLPPEPDRFSAEDLLERMRSLNGAWSGGLEDKS